MAVPENGNSTFFNSNAVGGCSRGDVQQIYGLMPGHVEFSAFEDCQTFACSEDEPRDCIGNAISHLGYLHTTLH